MPDNAQLYATNPGAIPNDTISAIESYSAPNSLCVLVMRATRPSKPSKIIAMKIATAALTKCPFIEETTA